MRHSGIDAHQKLVVYAAHLNIASDLDAIFDIVGIASGMLRACDSSSSEAAARTSLAGWLAPWGWTGLTTFTGHVPPAEVADYLRMGDAAIVYYKTSR